MDRIKASIFFTMTLTVIALVPWLAGGIVGDFTHQPFEIWIFGLITILVFSISIFAIGLGLYQLYMAIYNWVKKMKATLATIGTVLAFTIVPCMWVLFFNEKSQ